MKNYHSLLNGIKYLTGMEVYFIREKFLVDKQMFHDIIIYYGIEQADACVIAGENADILIKEA